jgi:hypothetical protein
MVELYNELSKRGLVILDWRPILRIRALTSKRSCGDLKINYPVGFITNELVPTTRTVITMACRRWSSSAQDGKMARRLIGWDEKNGKDLRDAILAQLQKLPTVKPGSKASSRPVRRATHA